MIEKSSEKQPLPKGRSQKDINKVKNHYRLFDLGCLILILIVLFLFVAYYPGFLAYRREGIRKSAFPFVETIHSSLRTYSNNHPKNLFPTEIKNYEVLGQIVNDAGKSIPKNQADTKIDYFKYETTDRNHYILRINIKDNTTYFFILYPDEIIEVYKHDPIDDQSVMELVRTILFMDRALKEKNMVEYLKYYHSNASIHIKNTTYKGSRTDKYNKKLKEIVYEDMDLYSNSLSDFYSNKFPEYRKRKEIFIKKNDHNWEVHSDYIEEGTIKGQKYLKDGRSMYIITLSKRPKYIVHDKSYSSICLFEN